MVLKPRGEEGPAKTNGHGRNWQDCSGQLAAEAYQRKNEIDLQPYPEELYSPVIPASLQEVWSFDADMRVLLADFRGFSKVPTEHRLLLLKMMEKDDISVVSEGLVNLKLNEIPLDAIEKCF